MTSRDTVVRGAGPRRPKGAAKTRPGAKRDARSGAVPARRVLRDWSLTLVLALLFAGSLSGLAVAGWHAENDDRREHGDDPVSFGRFLRSAEFGEPLFENWESEFLEMTAYVVLTIFLFQKGSSESKSPDQKSEVDEDPRSHRAEPSAPWPVRRGGFILKLYENSLSIVFALLFLMSFSLHAATGLARHNQEQIEHGQPPEALVEYVGSSQFWFESFQNWQSEFLALTSMVFLSIFLRQRGSPESKPVAMATWENAD